MAVAQMDPTSRSPGPAGRGIMVRIDNPTEYEVMRPDGRSGRHPRGDRSARRRAALPAALLARPEPDRAGLRQAQGAPAQSRRAHSRWAVDCHRQAARPVPAYRVRQLPP